MTPGFHVHVIDDEPVMQDSCREVLSRRGCEVSVSGCGRAGLLHVRNHPTDVVILDMKMPDIDGMEVLRLLHKEKPDIRVIIITGHPSVETAVTAMKLGAVDFIPKPFPPTVLRRALARTLEKRRKHTDDDDATPDDLPVGTAAILGDSPAMVEIRRLILKAAATDYTVLITGETGTGKELVARSLHHHHPLRDGSFVTVDCGGLVDTLIESELFGHVRGAFTGAFANRAGRFELANGGTLFLDEISNLDYRTQGKLLRVLQEREIARVGSARAIPVDARIVAASNSDLVAEINAGSFRVDLYYRLNTIPIHLPPLRERRGDIPLLAGYFLKRYQRLKPGGRPDRIAPGALEKMMRYDWPGNVRELEQVIKRTVALQDSPEADPFTMIGLSPAHNGDGNHGFNRFGLEDMEHIHIKRMLEAHNFNITRTAQALGIDRKTLRSKIRKYGIHCGNISPHGCRTGAQYPTSGTGFPG